MQHYRLRFHDEHGNVLRTMNLATRNIDTAKAAARALDHAYCIEICRGDEILALVEAAEKPHG